MLWRQLQQLTIFLSFNCLENCRNHQVSWVLQTNLWKPSSHLSDGVMASRLQISQPSKNHHNHSDNHDKVWRWTPLLSLHKSTLAGYCLINEEMLGNTTHYQQLICSQSASLSLNIFTQQESHKILDKMFATLWTFPNNNLFQSFFQDMHKSKCWLT